MLSNNYLIVLKILSIIQCDLITPLERVHLRVSVRSHAFNAFVKNGDSHTIIIHRNLFCSYLKSLSLFYGLNDNYFIYFVYKLFLK